MISRQKIAALHVAKSQLQIADEAWRALLQREGGVRSSRDLDDRGFLRVMTELERLGFRKVSRPIGPEARPGMATANQVGRIRSLWKAWRGEDNEPWMHRWIRQKFGVSHVRFLDAATAGKVVAVLEGIVARERKHQPACPRGGK